jgi:flagellin
MSSDSFSSNRSSTLNKAALQKSFEKLASGVRITAASDDPAGLAIVAALDAVQVQLSAGSRNSGYASSALSVADSALAQVSNISVRLQELATQASNGTLSDEQRGALDQEFQQLTQEAQRIGASTEFNGQSLLSGSSLTVQVGTDGSSQSQISVGGVDLAGLLSSLTSSAINSVDGARNALAAISDFSSSVSSARADLGASDSRLLVAAENNAAALIPLAEAESRIMDVNVAEEAANLVRRKILDNQNAALGAQSTKLISSIALKLLS